MRIPAIVVVAWLVAVPATAAQEAIGVLTRVPAADTASVSTESEHSAETRFCLNAGWFVLTAKVHDAQRASVAGIWPAGRMPPLNPSPEQASRPVADVMVIRRSREWAWHAFYVGTPQCYDLRVLGGRARVYQLDVGVNWRGED